MSAPKTFQIYEKHHASRNVGYRADVGIIDGARVFKSFPTRAPPPFDSDAIRFAMSPFAQMNFGILRFPADEPTATSCPR